LGLKHYCAKTRKNKFMVKRKTQAKRLARKLKAIREEMKHRMHLRYGNSIGGYVKC